jgi:multidrug transporter EmrE-like cation transporter
MAPWEAESGKVGQPAGGEGGILFMGEAASLMRITAAALIVAGIVLMKIAPQV